MFAKAALFTLISASLAAGVVPVDHPRPGFDLRRAVSNSLVGVSAVAGDFVTGTVLDPNGSGAESAVVVLSVLDDENSLTKVSLVRSGTDGHFGLGVPPEFDFAGFIHGRNEDVNFRVDSYSRGAVSSFFFTVQAGNSAPEGDKNPTVATVGRATVSLHKFDSESALTLRGHTLKNRTASSSQYSGVTPSDSTCDNSVVLRTDTPVQLLGYTADEAAGTSEHFTFTSSASSSLGVGPSYSGPAFGFGLSGKISKSSGLSARFPTTSGVGYNNYNARHIYTLNRECYTYCDGMTGCYRTDQWTYTPHGLSGGFSVVAAPRIGMGHCSSVGAGIEVIKDSTRAFESSVGVSSKKLIGIDLTASTGYSAATSISYSMGSKAHQWCGYRAYPGTQETLL